MTNEQFHIKYEQYLEPGFPGLELFNEDFIDWLDEKFQEFIKIKGFSYAQIKEKYYTGRFYCKGLTREQEKEVEDKIKELYKSYKEENQRKKRCLRK
jgi:hypothetical protein